MLRHQRRSAPPVYDGDFPDPFVLVTGDRYFVYGTQTGEMNVQVMESADLDRWEHRGDALPELPPWAGWGKTWSPAVLRRDDTYVLYYAVRYEAAGRQCISVATASDPAGPFVDRSGEPLIFQEDRGGSIDPSPFVDGDGTAYLLWKSDDNAVDRAPSLWGAPLRPDGLVLAGRPVELLRHDVVWEEPLVEAPSLARVADGAHVLFYSGGWWESDGYAIGYATGGAPLGPFRKETESGPWLASEPGMAGPGGAEVFTDIEGQWRIAFHAWTPPRVGYENGGVRSLWIERLDFEDGRPTLLI
ncbi:MAG TPA: glycoside hydrolase family 43 protein [Acidimicrobiia bacterium]|nr:glycoside hydrolase family 43 protein [Acidimicrobiia bacterium]